MGLTFWVVAYGRFDCKHRFLRFYFSVFSLVLVLIEKIYQALKTVFDYISVLDHLNKFVKNAPLRVIFSVLFSVFRNVVKHDISCLKYNLN